MPTRPAVPNVVKHQLHFRWGGQECVNVLWVEHSGAITQAMVDADRAVIDAWARADWAGGSASTAQLEKVKSWRFDVSPPVKFANVDYTLTAPIPGVYPGSSQIAHPWEGLVASLRTGLATARPRPPHGRIYHVGTRELPFSNGSYASTTVNATRLVYEQLLSRFTFTGNIGRWVVVSFWDGGTREAPVLRPSPAVLPITRVLMISRVAQQRRRNQDQDKYPTN